MNFNINLATKVYVDYKKVNICFTLAAAVLSCWLLFALYTAVDNAAKIKKLVEYKTRLLSHTAETKKVSASDYTAFLANVKNVNAILYRQSYDWLLLLSNLEQLVPEGVALNLLMPSDRGVIIKLSASARNFAGVRRFTENLESSKSFSEVYLTNLVAIKEAKQKGLNFTVTCKATGS